MLTFFYLFIVGITGWIITYINCNQDKFILKGISLFFIIDYIVGIINIYFNVNYFTLFFILQSIGLSYVLFCKIFSNIHTDKINKNYVNLIFYKPKTLRQQLFSLFGLSYYSCGIIIKDYLYQMRFENSLMQKREYTKEYIYSKYLVIKTDIKVNDLNKKYPNWEEELLKQKARQAKTLYLRFNCLRSLKEILKLSNKYKYNGTILPSLYLLTLKIKEYFNKLFNRG